MNNVLLIEDSADAFQLVKRALGASVHLEWAKTVRQATEMLDRKCFDLILLDVSLPDGDGFQLCSVMQTHDRWKTIPVLFVTARNSVADRVLGFSVGADDFISKPYDLTELKARVDAKIRKRERMKAAADILVFDDLQINKASQKATVDGGGGAPRDLGLTPIEFKILLLLASQPGVVMSRDQILNSVWGENIHVYSRSVDTHISKLRKKLGDSCPYIASVHGAGYRFVGGTGEAGSSLPKSFATTQGRELRTG